MRRFALLLALPLAFAFAAPARGAQTTGQVALRLVHQTSWNDPDHTMLSIEVRAVNDTEGTLGNLSLGVTIQTPTGSRSEYEESLGADTGAVALATAPPLEGQLEPGESKSYRVPPIDLTVLAQRDESAIYPMAIELRSNDAPVATLRSPVIYLAKPAPDVPLDLAWTFVLSAPILYEPDGAFRTPWLERQVAPGGQLRAEVSALAALADRRAQFDIAVSPQLIDQLAAMRDGYTLGDDGDRRKVEAGTGAAAAAGEVLKRLKATVASTTVELSALPFAAPSLPALDDGGLGDDIRTQLTTGRADVASALGRDPVTTVLHPPGSRLNQASLFELYNNGVRLVLVDSDTVAQPSQTRGFAKPAVAPLSVGADKPINAIAPDDGVQRLLDSTLPDQDPHLAVQVILGELAAIWLEQPSASRGVGLAMSERIGTPGYFFGPFVNAVDAAPWLRPIQASAMVRIHPPGDEVPAELVAGHGPTFSADYLADLQGARDTIGIYQSVFPRENGLPDNLLRMVLLAEAGQFASQEDLGRAFIDAIAGKLTGQFRLVSADTRIPVTLASRSGLVPVTIRNGTGQSVRVQVRLRSNRLTFVGGATRLVRIPTEGAQLTFNVQARTTGRFPVQVLITTPDGRTTLSERRLVVRSTAYNRFALVITIGAGLFLLALWARRLMPWARR
jgi:hypothetical protein